MMAYKGYGIDLLDLDYNPFINDETYKGLNYEIARQIQRLRLNMLVHSRLYYKDGIPIMSDQDFDKMAYMLRDLQKKYPRESRIIVYYEAFKDWDGTTGYHLPLTDPWVVRKAEKILDIHRRRV